MGWRDEETPREKTRRANWRNRYRGNPGVLRWLQKNPPPANWQSDNLDWAFTEMPIGNIE